VPSALRRNEMERIVGGAGGIRTHRPAANAQVVDFKSRSNRKKRQNRMSEVHGRYTGIFGIEYATECATDAAHQ